MASNPSRATLFYRRSNGRYNDVRRAYRARVKAAVFEKYGAICACCAEDELAFLTIDHRNNDGNLDRGPGRAAGYGFYLALYRDPPRPDLQVLCFNCNWGKYALGECPHRTALRIIA